MERLNLRRTGGSLEGERGRGVVPYLRFAVAIADEEGRMPRMEERRAEMRAVDLHEGAGLTVVARDRAVACFDSSAQHLSVVIHLPIKARFELHGDSS